MGKKPKRKRRENKRYEKYKIEGGKIVRPRYCPRCGAGVILASTPKRHHCGKCHYTEFVTSTSKGKAKTEEQEKAAEKKQK